jgi:hypothetical protein
MQEYQAPFNLIHETGWVREFETIEQLVKFCRAENIGQGLACRHIEHISNNDLFVDKLEKNPWIIRDYWGAIINPDEAFRSVRSHYRGRGEQRKLLKITAMINGLPIPYTGKNRYRNHVWMWRYPAHKGYQIVTLLALKNEASLLKANMVNRVYTRYLCLSLG